MKSLGRWFPLPLWLLLCILPHNCFPRNNLIFSFLPASIHYVFSAWNILFVCSFKCQLSYHYPCKISLTVQISVQCMIWLQSTLDLPQHICFSLLIALMKHCLCIYFFPMSIRSVFFLCILVSLNSSIIKTQLLCHIGEWIFICK